MGKGPFKGPYETVPEHPLLVAVDLDGFHEVDHASHFESLTVPTAPAPAEDDSKLERQHDREQDPEDYLHGTTGMMPSLATFASNSSRSRLALSFPSSFSSQPNSRAFARIDGIFGPA